MSTRTVHVPVQPGRAGGTTPPEARDPLGRYHAPRPPEAELAASRGLVLALLLVLPFWLIVALVSTQV